jgi:hypothetical protein
LAWNPVSLSLSVTILNQDVFPLNVTEISQTLPEGIDVGIGSGGGGAGPLQQKSDPRDFRRLLRLGGEAKRKEQNAKRKPKDCFSHEFPRVFFLLRAI